MVKHEITVFSNVTVGERVGKDLRNYPYVLQVGDVVLLCNDDVSCEAVVVQVEGTLVVFNPTRFV